MVSTPVGGVSLMVHGLKKHYQLSGGTTVRGLDGACLEAAAGSISGIRGRSGSGKSTLLHIVGAMDRPDEGTVLVDGGDLWSGSERERADYRSRVGFVFQQFHLLPALTAWENVATPVMPRRTGYDKRRRAIELLEQVGLARRSNAVPAELSGGEQQRVAMARALMVEPRLIVADEPTGNLDSQTGADVLDMIVELARPRRTTVLIATHDDYVASRCDRVRSIHDGRTQCPHDDHSNSDNG